MSLGCIASPGRAGVFWGFFHVSNFLNLPRKAKKSLGNGEKTSVYKEIYCILKYYIIIFIYAGHVAGVFCAQHTLTEALGNLQVFSLAGVLIEMLCGADKWGPLSLWRRTWFRVWKPKETVFLSKFSLDEFVCISSHSYYCLLYSSCVTTYKCTWMTQVSAAFFFDPPCWGFSGCLAGCRRRPWTCFSAIQLPRRPRRRMKELYPISRYLTRHYYVHILVILVWQVFHIVWHRLNNNNTMVYCLQDITSCM